MILAIIIAALSLFITPSLVLATDTPIQISPVDNSTITQLKPKLTWQYSGNCPIDTKISCFRVELDTSLLFPNPKYNYTNSFSYSPQTLTDGEWYWRVKAKDTSEIWSSWSTVWSFTLQSSSPSPTSIPIPTPTPTPTSNSSPSTSQSSSFTISNIPSQINSDQSFTVSITLSLSDKPNTNFYIKGAFKKPDGSNYFGLTKVSGNWVKNNSTYSNQFSITTDSLGNWSGNIEVQPDNDDGGFSGSGDYIFKVAKYNPLSWSNEVTIHINNAKNTQDPFSSQTPIYTEVTPTPAPSKSPNKTVRKVASVAGVSKSAISASSSASSTSANIKIANQKQINIFVLMGIIFIIAGVGSLGYIFLRKNETIYKYFSRRN